MIQNSNSYEIVSVLFQVDKLAETMAELHSKADRKEAQIAEAEEQFRRVSEDKPHPIPAALKDAITKHA